MNEVSYGIILVISVLVFITVFRQSYSIEKKQWNEEWNESKFIDGQTGNTTHAAIKAYDEYLEVANDRIDYQRIIILAGPHKTGEKTPYGSVYMHFACVK